MKDFDFLPLEFRKFSELLLTLLSFYQTYKCKGKDTKLLLYLQLKSRVRFFSESPPLVRFFLIFLSEIFYRKIFIIICWLMSTLGIGEAKWVLHITWQFSVLNPDQSVSAVRTVWSFKRKIANQEIIKFWYSSSSYQFPSTLRPVSKTSFKSFKTLNFLICKKF